MKSKYTDLDYTKCQMASMLYFLWWEIHFYVVGLVRLAFLDQRSVSKLMVLVDHREKEKKKKKKKIDDDEIHYAF